ncbi:MAG: hypothetical protein LCH32_10705 [Bacteroidetes bacterium]|nr:hypothetical protein [Bacteroidota bacterium]
MLPLVFISQNELFSEVYNKPTGINNNPNSFRVLSCIDKNIIYYLDAFNATNKNSLQVFSYYVKKDINSEKLEVLVNKQFKKLLHEPIYSFIIQKNILVLLTDEFIYIGKFHDQNKIKIIKSIKNQKFSYQKIMRLNDNELFLYVYYNYHPLDAPKKHVWAKLNLTSLELENIKYQDESEANFTHSIKNWVTTYKGLIANCSTTHYKINFYNNNFETYDSISTNFFDDNLNFLHLFKNSLNSKDEIQIFKRKDDSLLKRIEKIILLDSNTLLVNVKLPKQKDFEIHLWRKSNSKWKLIKKEIILTFYKDGDKYDSTNNILNPLFGNHLEITVENNFMYAVCSHFMPNVISNSFKMQDDYVDKLNEMIKENKLYYGIKKYKLNK